MRAVSRDIKSILERAYSDFHTRYHLARDPVSIVHEYKDPADQEVTAFLCALLSYGNVKTILTSCRRMLVAFGPAPSRTIRERSDLARLRGFRHRFTTADDIQILAHWLGSALQSHGSLEAFFLSGENTGEAPMKDRLSAFVRKLAAQPLPDALAKLRPKRERNLKYLISDPLRGSACKRLNMFLRWMVRPNDGVDLGLWRGVRTDQLMLPIDTHLLQTLRALKWTRSKQANWRVVESATAKLRKYEPVDPIRYDFALCHLSMSGHQLKKYGG